MNMTATHTTKTELATLGQRMRVRETQLAYLHSLEAEVESDLAGLMETKQKLRELLTELDNPQYQTVLSLRYFCGYTWEDIALKMHYSTRHVQRIHNKALEQLEQLLEGDE